MGLFCRNAVSVDNDNAMVCLMQARFELFKGCEEAIARESGGGGGSSSKMNIGEAKAIVEDRQQRTTLKGGEGDRELEEFLVVVRERTMVVLKSAVEKDAGLPDYMAQCMKKTYALSGNWRIYRKEEHKLLKLLSSWYEEKIEAER